MGFLYRLVEISISKESKVSKYLSALVELNLPQGHELCQPDTARTHVESEVNEYVLTQILKGTIFMAGCNISKKTKQ